MNESIVVDIILWVAGLLFCLTLITWIIHEAVPKK